MSSFRWPKDLSVLTKLQQPTVDKKDDPTVDIRPERFPQYQGVRERLPAEPPSSEQLLKRLNAKKTAAARAARAKALRERQLRVLLGGNAEAQLGLGGITGSGSVVGEGGVAPSPGITGSAKGFLLAARRAATVIPEEDVGFDDGEHLPETGVGRIPGRRGALGAQPMPIPAPHRDPLGNQVATLPATGWVFDKEIERRHKAAEDERRAKELASGKKHKLLPKAGDSVAMNTGSPGALRRQFNSSAKHAASFREISDMSPVDRPRPLSRVPTAHRLPLSGYEARLGTQPKQDAEPAATAGGAVLYGVGDEEAETLGRGVSTEAALDRARRAVGFSAMMAKAVGADGLTRADGTDPGGETIAGEGTVVGLSGRIAAGAHQGGRGKRRGKKHKKRSHVDKNLVAHGQAGIGFGEHSDDEDEGIGGGGGKVDEADPTRVEAHLSVMRPTLDRVRSMREIRAMKELEEQQQAKMKDADAEDEELAAAGIDVEPDTGADKAWFFVETEQSIAEKAADAAKQAAAEVEGEASRRRGTEAAFGGSAAQTATDFAVAAAEGVESPAGTARAGGGGAAARAGAGAAGGGLGTGPPELKRVTSHWHPYGHQGEEWERVDPRGFKGKAGKKYPEESLGPEVIHVKPLPELGGDAYVAHKSNLYVGEFHGDDLRTEELPPKAGEQRDAWSFPFRSTAAGLNLALKVHVEKIAMGRAHTLVLTSRAEVWSCGRGNEGQLGHGRTVNENYLKIIGGLYGIKVVDIQCGGWHSLALAEDGTAYSWGANGRGQLGVGDTVQRQTPTLITMSAGGAEGRDPSVDPAFQHDGSPVKQLSAGTVHTLLLADNGLLYTCGCGRHGQNGHAYTSVHSRVTHVGGGSYGRARANTDDHKTWPTPLLYIRKISIFRVRAGAFHSLLITDSGDVWTWGKASSGQLGHGADSTEDESEPRFVRGLQKYWVVEASLGLHHTFVLSSDNVLLAWGRNEEGQLGLGEPDKYATAGRSMGGTEWAPVEVPLPDDITVFKFRAGYLHSVLVSTIGHMYTTGYGLHGRLGLKSLVSKGAWTYVDSIARLGIMRDPFDFPFEEAEPPPEPNKVTREKEELLKIAKSITTLPDFLKREFTDTELIEFRRSFDQLDVDGSNSIDEIELKDALEALGERVNPKMIQLAIREVDTNSNGCVEFDEFVHMIFNMRSGISKIKLGMMSATVPSGNELSAGLVNKVQAYCKSLYHANGRLEAARVFNAMDADGSGEIDATELQDAFESLGIKLGKKKIAALIKRMDKDGNNTVSLPEFLDNYADTLDELNALTGVSWAINKYKQRKARPRPFLRPPQARRFATTFRDKCKDAGVLIPEELEERMNSLADPDSKVGFDLFSIGVLNLEDSGLRDTLMLPLAWTLKSCPYVRELRMNHNFVTDHGLGYLTSVFEHQMHIAETDALGGVEPLVLPDDGTGDGDFAAADDGSEGSADEDEDGPKGPGSVVSAHESDEELGLVIVSARDGSGSGGGRGGGAGSGEGAAVPAGGGGASAHGSGSGRRGKSGGSGGDGGAASADGSASGSAATEATGTAATTTTAGGKSGRRAGGSRTSSILSRFSRMSKGSKASKKSAAASTGAGAGAAGLATKGKKDLRPGVRPEFVARHSFRRTNMPSIRTVKCAFCGQTDEATAFLPGGRHDRFLVFHEITRCRQCKFEWVKPVHFLCIVKCADRVKPERLLALAKFKLQTESRNHLHDAMNERTITIDEAREGHEDVVRKMCAQYDRMLRRVKVRWRKRERLQSELARYGLNSFSMHKREYFRRVFAIVTRRIVTIANDMSRGIRRWWRVLTLPIEWPRFVVKAQEELAAARVKMNAAFGDWSVRSEWLLDGLEKIDKLAIGIVRHYYRMLQHITTVDAAAGSTFSGCITAAGELWTWGDGIEGRTGHGADEPELAPRILLMARPANDDMVLEAIRLPVRDATGHSRVDWGMVATNVRKGGYVVFDNVIVPTHASTCRFNVRVAIRGTITVKVNDFEGRIVAQVTCDPTGYDYRVFSSTLHRKHCGADGIPVSLYVIFQVDNSVTLDWVELC